ncbi:hypothetical protein GUITHDRAFT_107720 [Guillardia theta CCMP2712]|uniref:Uncharacterized protein n=1 Tax=Guillardia theta (strain CCMP2712) TaxID=905079 RepID=L1JEH7_GUITC|nr:hypothetical protein GUITHDRAFT_107720 [Guillardia theta CCMP2712]EKX46515.1 hypothetical protein GUITHDRAFT_107720 [Guillardia theta CCMP2712]|eukprot:XP_005833495.1 hypothetical protein GUITHDRAFT_107720 [Guillardia theta CCMP2712]
MSKSERRRTYEVVVQERGCDLPGGMPAGPWESFEDAKEQIRWWASHQDVEGEPSKGFTVCASGGDPSNRRHGRRNSLLCTATRLKGPARCNWGLLLEESTAGWIVRKAHKGCDLLKHSHVGIPDVSHLRARLQGAGAQQLVGEQADGELPIRRSLDAIRAERKCIVPDSFPAGPWETFIDAKYHIGQWAKGFEWGEGKVGFAVVGCGKEEGNSVRGPRHSLCCTWYRKKNNMPWKRCPWRIDIELSSEGWTLRDSVGLQDLSYHFHDEEAMSAWRSKQLAEEQQGKEELVCLRSEEEIRRLRKCVLPQGMPQGPWDSFEQAKASINRWTCDESTGGGGWAVISSSWTKSSSKKGQRQYLSCFRSGRPQETSFQDSIALCCACPWKVELEEAKEGWVVRDAPIGTDLSFHNHDLIQSGSSISSPAPENFPSSVVELMNRKALVKQQRLTAKTQTMEARSYLRKRSRCVSRAHARDHVYVAVRAEGEGERGGGGGDFEILGVFDNVKAANHKAELSFAEVCGRKTGWRKESQLEQGCFRGIANLREKRLSVWVERKKLRSEAFAGDRRQAEGANFVSTFEGQDSEENREEEDRQDEDEAMETEMERKALNFLCSAPSALPSSSSSSQKQPPHTRVKWLNGGGDAGAEGSRYAEHADLLADPLLSFPALVSERSSFLFKSSEDSRAASKKLGGSSSRGVLETSLQEEELAGMASDRPSPLLCPLSWEANASMLNNS